MSLEAASHGSGTAPRYRLRADAFFVKSGDGVWLRNNRGSFSIGGTSAYPLVKLLFMRLQEPAALEDVCRGTDARVRSGIEALLRKLEEYGFVRRVLGQAEEIPSWASALYSEKLRFIDEHGESAFSRFLSFRNQRIACRGDRDLMRAVAITLVEYGASRLTLCPDSSAEAQRELVGLAAAAAQRDPQVGVVVKQTSDDADVTIWLATSPRDLALQLEAASRRDGTQAAIVRHGADLVVSTALEQTSDVCLECAHRALGEPTTPGPSPVPRVAASLAAQQVVYDLFVRATGITADEAPLLRTIDCDTLEIQGHRLHPHPLCRRHGAVRPLARAALAAPLDGPAGVLRPDVPASMDPTAVVEVQNSIISAIGGLTDPLCGPLLRAGEGALPQLPLAESECSVREVRGERAGTERSFVCRGLSARETHNQAALVALEWLATELLAMQANSAAGFVPKACGAGWSADEAAYRALVQLSVGLDARSDSENGASTAPSSGPATFLSSLLSEHASDPVECSVALASTGLYVATAVTSTKLSARGAGVTRDNARINALMGLAARVVTDTEDTRPALLTSGLVSFRAALAEARARSTSGQAPKFWDLTGLFPFARRKLHVVGLEWRDGS